MSNDDGIIVASRPERETDHGARTAARERLEGERALRTVELCETLACIGETDAAALRV
jgi:hypothetical protein